MSTLKVTFDLDGTGIVYCAAEPIHLDALLGYALASYHVTGPPPDRDERPTDIPLPLKRWKWRKNPKMWGWAASALIPEGPIVQTIRYRRRKMRQHRVEYTSGSPNRAIGTSKEWNTPVLVVLCTRLVGYCEGKPKRIRHVLKKHIKSLGKDRAHGFGRISDITVEPYGGSGERPWLSVDEMATRYLPTEDASAIRLVRTRPPYWNIVDRVLCCEIGDPIDPGEYL